MPDLFSPLTIRGVSIADDWHLVHFVEGGL
jgi:hypothetical protein